MAVEQAGFPVLPLDCVRVFTGQQHSPWLLEHSQSVCRKSMEGVPAWSAWPALSDHAVQAGAPRSSSAGGAGPSPSCHGEPDSSVSSCEPV